MPGSLLEGYLRAQAHAREQETLADQKKAQKLEEALNQLRLKQLGQSMAQAAEEFRYQQRKRAELDEVMARLRAGTGTELDYALAGLKAPAVETTGPERTKIPWWLGTPHEERYLRKETYVKPEAIGGLEDLYGGIGEFGGLTLGGRTPEGALVYEPGEEISAPPMLPSLADIEQEIAAQRGGARAAPLMMGGQEFPAETTAAAVGPSVFSPEFGREAARRANIELAETAQAGVAPIDWDKTRRAYQKIKNLPASDALADLEENRAYYRGAGIDVSWLIKKIGGKR